MRNSEKLLIAGTVVGVLHHVDHVLRLDHSGWPFIVKVTPFTYSLVVYPIILVALLARSRPKLRAACTGMVCLFATFSHSYFETPLDQFTTWTHGSQSAGHVGEHGLLGIQSTVMGIVAVTITILLSTLFLAATIAFIKDSRR